MNGAISYEGSDDVALFIAKRFGGPINKYPDVPYVQWSIPISFTFLSKLPNKLKIKK